MRVTVRQWGSFAVVLGAILVLSGGAIGFAIPLTSSGPVLQEKLTAPSQPAFNYSKLASGNLPEFPTNLTHFVYIVRENHVFDDYLGDCSLTINDTCNGGQSYTSPTSGTSATETAPSGDQLLTPNLHHLARNYAVFDNMYSSIDPYSAQAHAYLFTANSWGSTDSCAPGGVEGTGATTEWGIYNASNVRSGSCAWASDSGSQSYDTTGGSIFDRFLGTNIPQSKTTPPFLSDGDIIWELSSPGCTLASSSAIPGDSQSALQVVTGCSNGWWYNTTSGSPDMPPAVNTVTGVPQMLWQCQYACSGSAPNPFLDSYVSNSFKAYVADYGLPTYTFVELFDDHPGGNCGQTQSVCIQWNDAAMSSVVGTIENSTTYSKNTVIAITEDDTQNGQNGVDHVNSGRRLPFVMVAPHTVEKTGGAPSTCGIAATYSSCGYVVHQTFNTSNVLAVMERVEMNVNPTSFYLGGVAPSKNQFPMIQNDYLAEGNPLEPLWKCAGANAAYCNTGVTNTTQTLASASISPNPLNAASSSTTTLTASALDTSGSPITSGVTYTWSYSPTTLGSLSSTTGTSVTFTAGTSAVTGNIYVNASYNSLVKQASDPTTVSTTVSLASVAISPTGTVGVNPSGTKAFGATSLGTNGGSLTSSTTFNWTLSSTALGSLNASTGTAVTFTAGTTTGNVTICVNGTYSGTTKGPSCATISITNSPPTLTSVTISPSTSLTLGEGSTTTFNAQAKDQYGNNMSSGITYTWSLSAASLGSLSSTTGTSDTFTAGTTAGATGTVSVTATSGPAPPVTATDAITVFGVTATESATSGAAPLTVSFTATAAGGSGTYSYSWIFGDGNTSASQNPSNQYCTAGQYTPTVTVSDSSGHTATSSLAAITVTGNCHGTVSLTSTATATPTTGAIPLTCDFTGSAQGGTAPYTFSWSFGDGQTGSGSTVSHTYTSTGTFTVTMYVNDSAGHSANPYHLTVSVNPTISGQLAVALAASPVNGSSPLTVDFDAAASGGSGSYVSYAWNFGDGSTGVNAQTAHTYTTPRSTPYMVELTVTDSSGNVGHAFANITVSQGTNQSNSGSSATPWWFWAMLIVIAVLIIAVIAVVARSRKPKQPAYDQYYEPQAGYHNPPPSQ